METTPSLQLSEFQKALTPQRMRAFQIIPVASLMGVTLFLGVILYVYSTHPPAEEKAGDNTLAIMSILHAGMGCICYLVGFLVFRRLTSLKGLDFLHRNVPARADLQPELPIELRCVGVMSTACILRAAIFEGPVTFGLVVCLLGSINGQIHLQPVYWLNLFSSVLFAALTVWTFPTKDRLETIFKDRFLQSDFSI